jgi:hypothetical protein
VVVGGEAVVVEGCAVDGVVEGALVVVVPAAATVPSPPSSFPPSQPKATTTPISTATHAPTVHLLAPRSPNMPVEATDRYPPEPMQTRLLLIASALLAVVILVAGGLWLYRLLT